MIGIKQTSRRCVEGLFAAIIASDQHTETAFNLSKLPDVSVTAIHHHHVVEPQAGRVAVLCGDPWETLERERGILKGCDRTDVASPSHVVSPTRVDWMDRVRRSRVLGCRIWSDPVGVAGDLMWSPQLGITATAVDANRALQL